MSQTTYQKGSFSSVSTASANASHPQKGQHFNSSPILSAPSIPIPYRHYLRCPFWLSVRTALVAGDEPHVVAVVYFCAGGSAAGAGFEHQNTNPLNCWKTIPISPRETAAQSKVTSNVAQISAVLAWRYSSPARARRFIWMPLLP